MIRVEQEGETITVISDDANAENAALGDAVDECAPHLLADFEGTDADGDGELHWKVRKADWNSLLEVLETAAASGFLNPEEAELAAERVALAIKESGDQ